MRSPASLLVVALAAVVTTVAPLAAAGDLSAGLAAAQAGGCLPGPVAEAAAVSGDPALVRRALGVLAAAGDPATLPLARRLAAAGGAAVAGEAALTGARLGPGGADLVLVALDAADPAARRAAAWAACEVGGAAGDALLARLDDEGDARVLEVAAANLWRLPKGSWEQTAVSLSRAPDPAVRRAAAYALARSGAPPTRPTLRGLTSDPLPATRAVAVRGLGRGEPSAADGEALEAALADPDWRVRVAACQALAAQPALRLGGAAAARLVALLDADQPHLVVAAAAALGAHPEAPAGDALVNLVAEGERWLAGEALAALARRRDPRFAALAEPWWSAEDGWRRRAAARASAVGPAATAAATRALADSEAAVRLAFLEGLQAAGGDLPADVLGGVLASDPDAAVRAQALDMREASAPPAPAELLALAHRWRGDAPADARLGALEAAFAAGDETVRDRVLLAAAGDHDPVVAARIAAQARRAGVAAIAPRRPLRHPLAWYGELESWAAAPRWLDVVTARGTFRIKLDPDTPATAREVWDLAANGFYDGLPVHRVVPDFVVQGGDPRGDGWGGPGFVLADEPTLTPFDAWRVGIATSGPNTGGCQLFVTLMPADHLTGHYTNLGEVVRGREIVERLEVGDMIRHVLTAEGDEPPPPPPVLLGRVGWDDLAVLPGWREEYEAYQPDQGEVERLRQAMGAYRIVTVLGSWCSDSQREVPRLVKVLRETDNPGFSSELWAVDRSRRVADRAFPAGLLPGRTAARVPTVLVLDAATGVELGRVVETAQAPLEELLVEMIAPMEGW